MFTANFSASFSPSLSLSEEVPLHKSLNSALKKSTLYIYTGMNSTDYTGSSLLAPLSVNKWIDDDFHFLEQAKHFVSSWAFGMDWVYCAWAQ